MLIKYLSTSLIVLTFVCINPFLNQAATFIGGSGNNFSTPANWVGGSKPATPNQDIIISSFATMVIDEDYTCNNLTINSYASFSCTGGHVLTILGNVINDAGNAVIIVGSALQVSSGITIPDVNLTSGTFIDGRDSKTYSWVKIGTQIWMAENLNYATATGSWFYNDDEATYGATYGRLYDWATAMDGAGSSDGKPSGVQGVCPNGWHLPSYSEWGVLRSKLGGDDAAGNKLKEAGTTHWNSPNSGNNSSGFTALGGGYRMTGGSYGSLKTRAYFWSSTQYNADWAYVRYLYNNYSYFYTVEEEKTKGNSIRCVKD